MQALGDVQETPLKLLVPAARFGPGVFDHLLPFQCSASAPFAGCPTVMQNVVDVHDTLANGLSPEPFGLGAGSVDQRDPFHRSTSARYLPARVAR